MAGLMTDAPAAIRATFSQYSMVKTRGVLVLHMEVALEQQADVFAALGYPLPGQETWVAIARLNPRAGAKPEAALGAPPDSPNASAAADEQGGGYGRTVGSIPATGASLQPGAGAEAVGRLPIAAPTDASEGSSPSAGTLERSLRGKAVYVQADDMTRAVTRAALLAKDERFKAWVAQRNGWGSCAESNAAEEIRVYCKISSRSEIGANKGAYQRFSQLETEFLLAAGQLAEPR